MSTYSLTVVGPGDEVLDVIVLDGTDLAAPYIGVWLAAAVEDAMGTVHATACAALPEPSDDEDEDLNRCANGCVCSPEELAEMGEGQ